MSEIELLRQEIQHFKDDNDRYHVEQDERHKKYEEKIDEIHTLLTAGGLVGKTVLWIAGLITTVGAAYLMIKQIFLNN